MIQLNSTQREYFTDAGETPHCPHLLSKLNTKLYVTYYSY